MKKPGMDGETLLISISSISIIGSVISGVIGIIN